MDLFKIIFIIGIGFLVIACVRENPKVLVGLESIQKDNRTGEDYTFENDLILGLSEDSIEFVPLWQRGCIFAPTTKKKFKLYENNDFDNYIISDGDTINVIFDYLDNNILSTYIDDVESKYLPVADVKLNVGYVELVGRIKGRSFQFLIKDWNWIVSFYENGDCIINREIEEARFINRGHWFVEQYEDYFFLILDDTEKVYKFQISRLFKKGIDVFRFENSKKEAIAFMEVFDHYLLPKNGMWVSEITGSVLEQKIIPNDVDSYSESWLFQNHKFIAQDTSTISSLQSYPNSFVYVDWKSNVIIVDYEVILGFDIDAFDRRKIKVFPTNEDGEINKRFFKIYSLY